MFWVFSKNTYPVCPTLLQKVPVNRELGETFQKFYKSYSINKVECACEKIKIVLEPGIYYLL